MTFEWIVKAFVSPIFFFLSLMLATLTMVSLYEAYLKNPAFIVVAGLFFVLSFNAFRIGWKLFRDVGMRHRA